LARTLYDVSGATGGPSDGTILYGGSPVGPVWSFDSPFHPAHEVTNSNNSGTGSLRQTITNAPSGSTIVFAPHLQNSVINLSSQISIDKSLTIKDLNTSKVQVQINGDGPAFQILSGGNVTLQSFRIQSGNGTNGRAIQNQGLLTLQDMLVNDLAPGTGSSILNTGTLLVLGQVIVD
jgi:hypothetical protein